MSLHYLEKHEPRKLGFFSYAVYRKDTALFHSTHLPISNCPDIWTVLLVPTFVSTNFHFSPLCLPLRCHCLHYSWLFWSMFHHAINTAEAIVNTLPNSSACWASEGNWRLQIYMYRSQREILLGFIPPRRLTDSDEIWRVNEDRGYTVLSQICCGLAKWVDSSTPECANLAEFAIHCHVSNLALIVKEDRHSSHTKCKNWF